MSIIQSKAERTQVCGKAFTLTWNINHGTVVQCTTLAEHIQAIDGLLQWEYAIEEKPDGLGKKYHLHMFILFGEDKVRDSLKRNILRRGQAIGKSADPTAKITAVSVELKRAFDENWLTGYCHGKECPEVVKADISGPFKEEWRIHFPSQEEQQEFQKVANSADELYEKLAIEFKHWCEIGDEAKGIPFNGDYASYQEGKTNLEELVCAFLDDMMFKHKRMKVINDKRRLVMLKQSLESYVAVDLGVSRTKYRKWFATQAEIEARPSSIKKKQELQAIEDDILINSVLNS